MLNTSLKLYRCLVATLVAVVIFFYLIAIESHTAYSFDGISFATGNYKKYYSVQVIDDYGSALILNKYVSTEQYNILYNHGYFTRVGSISETNNGDIYKLYYYDYVDCPDLISRNLSDMYSCPRTYIDERNYNSSKTWSYFDLSYSNECDNIDSNAITFSCKNITTALTLKVDCPNNLKPTSININASFQGAWVSSGDFTGKEFLINNLPPVSGLTWTIPVTADCGETFTLTSGASAKEAMIFAQLNNIKANYCRTKITNLIGTQLIFNPSSGSNVGINGTITDSSGQNTIWTATVADRTFSGTGKAPNFSWYGKNNNGQIVPEGTYQITLTAKTADGTCSDSKSLPITVKSCDFKITDLAGTNKMLDPSAGGSVGISGAISNSSGKPLSWTLNILDQTFTGTGSSVNATWDGKYADGTVVQPGECHRL